MIKSSEELLGSKLGPRKRWPMLAVFLLMVPLFLGSRLGFTAVGQTVDNSKKIIKKIDFIDSHVKEPIEIVEVRSNGKVVHLDESFADDQWLKDLVIKFKNVSDKTITHLDFNLLFPETRESGLPLSYSLHYGLFRSQQYQGALGMKELRPGDTSEVTLGLKDYGQLKEALASRKDINDFTLVNLTVAVAYFDDGMQWSAGDLFRPDPARPGKFVIARDNQ